MTSASKSQTIPWMNSFEAAKKAAHDEQSTIYLDFFNPE